MDQAEMDALPATEDEATAATEPVQAQPRVDEQTRRAILALYGAKCPLVDEMEGRTVADGDYVAWARDLWERHRGGSQKRVHFAMRNRLFYQGHQWVSSSGPALTGIWREPPKPRDAARRVANMIRPALDQRTQIVADQRPGFRVEPQDRSPASIKRAQSRQIALEYQHKQQDMARVIREARHWAGTDGVSILRTFWDPDRGPWSESFEPTGETGPDGSVMMGEPQRRPMGELATKVYRIEQVRVAANATATEKPHYWVLREVVSTAAAVATHGPGVLGEHGEAGGFSTHEGGVERRGDTVSADELLQDQPTLERFTIDCAPSEFLPDGWTVVVVGEALVYSGPLPMGVVPNVPFRDGSADPAFFPEPVMDDWIADQMTANAALSKWIERERRSANGAFVTRAGSVVGETLIGGLSSNIEIKGDPNRPISDHVMPAPMTGVDSGPQKLYELAVKNFEQKSGWNDTTRGTFGSGESGRSILAQREQVEQVFAPDVNAAAEAMVGWAEVCCAGMATYYDEPRRIAVAGKSRPDLGRELTREDFDGVADITLDPETLMPLPRALRLALLQQLYEQQILTADEYRRRLPMAYTRDLETPDDVQHARAQRVAMALLNGDDPGPILWQDDEAIHQTVLDTEIILSGDAPPEAQAAAQARWVALAQQAQMKSGMGAPMAALPGAPGDPMGGAGGAVPEAPMDPALQPTSTNSPGVAAAPLALESSQEAAVGTFESVTPQ